MVYAIVKHNYIRITLSYNIDMFIYEHYVEKMLLTYWANLNTVKADISRVVQDHTLNSFALLYMPNWGTRAWFCIACSAVAGWFWFYATSLLFAVIHSTDRQSAVWINSSVVA